MLQGSSKLPLPVLQSATLSAARVYHSKVPSSWCGRGNPIWPFFGPNGGIVLQGSPTTAAVPLPLCAVTSCFGLIFTALVVPQCISSCKYLHLSFPPPAPPLSLSHGGTGLRGESYGLLQLHGHPPIGRNRIQGGVSSDTPGESTPRVYRGMMCIVLYDILAPYV